MRIAIATDWFAPRRGGIESQLAQLAARLGERGHHVDVLTSTPGATNGHSFHVRRLPGVVLPKTHVALSPTILGELRRVLERSYDVVHAHVSVMSPVGYAAAGIARSLGLPTVVTFHSVLLHKLHLLRVVNQVVGLSRSPVVWTAVSELVASQVRRALVGADVTVLSNGIDVAFWRTARTQAVRRSSNHVTLVSTMRLHSKKRPRQLLVAFAEAVRHSGAPVLLRVVGDGPERDAMERDIRLLELHRGHARVEMMGWLPPEALRAAYADADGFVLASKRESFGIAALEAVAAGLPVIVMAAAGCREFLGDADLMCSDDAKLAEAIARMIETSRSGVPKLRSTTQLDRYDWLRVLEKHEATYNRAMTRAAAEPPVVA